MGVEGSSLTSARLRFRPSLMTAFASSCVVPLMKRAVPEPGPERHGHRRLLRDAGRTAFGVFLIPGNFAFVERLRKKKKQAAAVQTGRTWRSLRCGGPSCCS